MLGNPDVRIHTGLWSVINECSTPVASGRLGVHLVAGLRLEGVADHAGLVPAAVHHQVLAEKVLAAVVLEAVVGTRQSGRADVTINLIYSASDKHMRKKHTIYTHNTHTHTHPHIDVNCSCPGKYTFNIYVILIVHLFFTVVIVSIIDSRQRFED